MTIVRRAVRPEASFYTLDKRISEDKRLSWAARGMLVFLLGKPDHWQVSVAHLTNETKGALGRSTGRDAVYGLLQELIDAGYVDRVQARAEGGRMAATEYLVQEVPAVRVAPVSPLPEKPGPAHPDTAQPVPANPTLASTDLKQGLKGQQHNTGDGGAGEAFPELPEWLPVEAWNGWVQARAKAKSPVTAGAAKLAIKTLDKLRAQGHAPGDVLDQSTLSGWTGLFAVKGSWKGGGAAGESLRERRMRERHSEMSGGLVAAKAPGLPPVPVGALMPQMKQPQGAIDV